MRTDAEHVHDDVDLSGVANSAARLAGLAAAQVRIAPKVFVPGNATMLQRLLTNLLDNAARHGAPPILLSLAINRALGEAVVMVEDHGPGIVDAQRMLQPFERGDASRAQRGAGLGLAIVARIVERHAGTLDIGAVDGGGTRVTVRLPLAKAARVTEPQASTRAFSSWTAVLYPRDRIRRSSAASSAPEAALRPRGCARLCPVARF